PQTSNLKPQTSNLKPQTSNLKPQTYSCLSGSLRLSYLISLRTDDLIPIKKFHDVLSLNGIQLKFKFQLSKSL
ncbi:hypothetical protein GBO31_15520, partial [Aquimarina litoralis]|nr:hypothetical protein [Aquimarina litoralis]